MTRRSECKQTLFDRHGSTSWDYMRAWAYGVMVFGLTVAAFTLRAGFRWWTIPTGVVVAAAASALGLFVAHVVGSTWKRLMADGRSTPYNEQYSQQQALVMQGKIDEALESVIRDEGATFRQHRRQPVRLRAKDESWGVAKTAALAMNLRRA